MNIKRSLLGGFMLALATVAFATPPEGYIEINYHRCDKKYTNWGVHLWQDPNMPLEDIAWPDPMKPTGTSEFGIYWHRKLSEFGNKGHVNYIIHKGDIKEQGSKDMDFNGNEHKAIWVRTKESTTFFSLADAMKDHVCK
jgi:hypothetical protein